MKSCGAQPGVKTHGGRIIFKGAAYLDWLAYNFR